VAEELGIFPLGVALSPGELLPLHIFEERYKELIGECVEHEQPFLLLFADEAGTREVGCTARVVEVLERFDDGRMNIVVEGADLVRVVEITRGRPFTTGRVEPVEDDLDAGEEREAALEMYRSFAAAAGLTGDEDDISDDEGPLSYAIMARVEFPAGEKQEVLELRSERARLMALVELLARGMQALQKVEEIRRRAQTNGKVPHQ
jgi:Lon protease-like protein